MYKRQLYRFETKILEAFNIKSNFVGHPLAEDIEIEINKNNYKDLLNLDKSGVYAVRQAPILYKNILKLFKNKQLIRFKPQSDYLKLIVYEGESAIFLRNGVAFSAKWVWALKSFIDKKFIKNFKKLSEMVIKDMKNARSNNQKMLC